MYKLSKEDKEWHQQFMNKGKTPIDMSEYTPIKGMEGPFRFTTVASSTMTHARANTTIEVWIFTSHRD